MKKVLSRLLLFLTLFLAIAVSKNSAHHETRFPDVNSTHPNYVAIEYFRVRNMAKGYSDGNFHPGKRVNRAEFITMVIRVLEVDPDEDEFKNCYSDVRKQWFADEVCYAKSEGWLDGMGSPFRPSKKVSATEAYRIVTKAFDTYNIDAVNNFTGSLTRGDTAQMLYQVLLLAIQRGTYTPPSQYSLPSTGTVNYSTIDVPSGYPRPWTPSGASPSPSPSPSYSSNSYACQASAISSYPTRTASSYSVNSCPLDNTGAPSTQLLLGQAYLSTVWGEPLNFTYTDKMRAMALGYASEMFNMNPNYLMGLAMKESKGNCSYYGGCFQIIGGFPEVRNRFPLYFDANDSQEALVNGFGTAAVIASLYIRFGETLWDRDYQWKNFYQSASDSEARTKIVSRGYNRGLWEAAIRTMVQTNRSQCQSASNVFQCFPSGPITTADGIALDHAQSVVNYCRSFMQSTNFYDPQLSRQDVTDFIEQVLKPTFSQTSGVNWTTVTQRASDAFGCLQNSSGTISLRYDFKTLLQSLKQVLPAVPVPIL